MSESHVPSSSSSKTVQEQLLVNGDETPQSYIYKDGIGHGVGVLDHPYPLMEIPTVDLKLLESSLTAAEPEFEKLVWLFLPGAVFRFDAINHGIPGSFLDRMSELTKMFFSLPMEEKNKYLREVDDLQGYGNDMILSDHQILDWTDRLYLIVNPEDERKLKVWPQNPPSFREDLEEYAMKLKQITKTVGVGMARSLKLEPNRFINQLGKRLIMLMRFNLFPPCQRPDLVLGLKQHSDGSFITIVLLDKQVEGLQFLKDNQWFRVPVMSDSLLINLGDQAEIMSNGIMKSPVHRVVTNSERERMSLACFCSAETDKEIEVMEELIDETRPRLYQNVKNYVDTYFQHYQKGNRPIDAVKI